MKAMKFILAGGVAVAALTIAAPASAQYYPGNPYGYGGGGYGGNVIGQVLNQVLGGGYGGGYGGYGYNSQAAINQCAAAVQARIGGGYGAYGGGYGGYGGYGAYGSTGARVLGVSRIEPRSGGGLTVRGVASSGAYAGYGGYGGGYGTNSPVDLTWRCRIDSRGFVRDIDVDRVSRSYSNNYNNYDPYNPYAAYGYRRY